MQYRRQQKQKEMNQTLTKAASLLMRDAEDIAEMYEAYAAAIPDLVGWLETRDGLPLRPIYGRPPQFGNGDVYVRIPQGQNDPIELIYSLVSVRRALRNYKTFRLHIPLIEGVVSGEAVSREFAKQREWLLTQSAKLRAFATSYSDGLGRIALNYNEITMNAPDELNPIVGKLLITF